jgi:hypothetical protein
MARRRIRSKYRKPQISILMPFRADPRAPERVEIFNWVVQYWHNALPDAEIVIGRSKSKIFSKTEAVNNAARRAKGRIFIILDSDAYMRPEVLQDCADQIDRAEARGQHLWFIPYRHLYRLTKEAGRVVLDSDPLFPIQFPEPPLPSDILNQHGSMHGHRFGALVQMMSRKAFYMVGGMDPRFRGWGGEDVAFVRAMDTIYGPHKTTRNDILHIWHPTIGSNAKDRMWHGQDSMGENMKLTNRYNRATGDPAAMRKLVDEAFPQKRGWFRKTLGWFGKHPGLWSAAFLLGCIAALAFTAIVY